MENFDKGEQLSPPPEFISLDDSPVNSDDLSLISSRYLRKAQENLDRMRILRLENELKNGAEEENLTPEDLLIQLALLSKDYMVASPEAFARGDFDDPSRKLIVEDGCVVLVRHASDGEHLIKSGKTASPEEMRDSSLSQAGAPEAGAVHTSANVDNVGYAYSRYPIYGEFRIPVKDFIELAQKHKIILGNVGECEVIISGDVAQEYLTKVVEKAK